MFAENYVKAGRRSSLAIHAFVGRNGHGKDLAMVHDTIPFLMRGLEVLSTVELRDWTRPCTLCHSNPCVPECGKRAWPTHSQWVPFLSFQDLIDFKGGLVLMSEVQGVASAREHQGLPYEVANFLRKLRHSDVPLFWNAPDWMAPDAVIRRVTQAVTVCRGSMGVPHPLPCTTCGEEHATPIFRGCKDGRARLWADNRMFRWDTYDAHDFGEFEQSKVADAESRKRAKLRPLVRQRYWRGPESLVQTVYDTHGEVLSLGSADMAGTCITCGGLRRRRPCSCADHVAPSREPVAARGAPAGAEGPAGVRAPRSRRAPTVRYDIPAAVSPGLPMPVSALAAHSYLSAGQLERDT